MNNIETLYNSIIDEYQKIVTEYVVIDDNNLSQEMVRLPAIHAFFGELLAFSKERLDTITNFYETLDSSLKGAIYNETQKKVTAAHADASVNSNPQIARSKNDIVQAAHRYTLARNLLSSLEVKKDMIVQLSANKRAEAKLFEQN